VARLREQHVKSAPSVDSLIRVQPRQKACVTDEMTPISPAPSA